MSRQATKARTYEHVATRENAAGAVSSLVAKRLKITIAAALLAGFALSPKLWLSDRVYPLTPVLAFLPPIPVPFDLILYTALLLSLVLVAIAARPVKFISASLAIALVLALFDQSRWQPWFYQYLIMLGALAWYYRRPTDDEDHPALNTCRLVMVCTYFWSGLQKVQPGFMFQLFPWMIASFTKSLPPAVAKTLNSFGMVAPFIEIAIGIALLIPRLRRYAIFAAIGMHAFILLALGPLGKNFNSVVWPWNVAMVLFLLILFWGSGNQGARSVLWARGIYAKVVLLLFGVAPAFSFFDLWDKDLSCAMYTGPHHVPMIYVTNSLADRLPKQILEHVYVSSKAGQNIVQAFDWPLAEINAAVYPEPRIYKSLGRRICSYAQDPSEMRMVIWRQNVLFSPDRESSYTCLDLTK